MTQTVLLGALMTDSGYIRGPFGSALRRPEMKDNGVPVYEQQNAIYNNRNFRFFIDDKKYEELKRFTVRPGDLVISCSGTLGKITVIREDDPIGIISQALLILRPDIAKVSSNFLYYFLTSPEGQYLLLGASHGSVQVNIAKREVVSNIKIQLPSLDEQSRIVNILKTFDEKIELNRKMNETLEQMGQTLFGHYFIDNPEAERWNKKPLDEIADFLNGLAMQKYPKVDGKPTLPVIKIREMSSGITPNTDIAGVNIPDKYLVNDGDLLFSWSGTLIVKFWTGGKGALNQHLFKVTSEEYPQWFYYYWLKHYLDEFIETAKSKATTMGHIQRRHLHEAIVLVPDIEKLEEFTTIFEPLLKQQVLNMLQIQTLTTLRDILLPRLISGKILKNDE